MTDASKDPSGCRTDVLDGIRAASERAKLWFLTSGIQISSDSEDVGAFYAWYDADTQKYGFLYPEATGYGILFMLYLNRCAPDRTLVRRARDAADWILRRAFFPETRSVRHRFDLKPFRKASELSYSFDNGIIISGLVRLAKESGESRYLDAARQIADKMIAEKQCDDGSFCSHWDVVTNECVPLGPKWSTRPAPHHAKIAIAMVRLSRATGERKYAESALKICEWTVSRQQSDGRFVTDETDGSTLLHPHCYALEGLFYTGILLGADRFVQSAVRGLRWLISSQNPQGGIPAEFRNGSFSKEERGDSLAQAVRLIALAVRNRSIDRENLIVVARMTRRLFDFQCLEDPLAEKGSFYFMVNGEGERLNHLNSWATMFAVQALDYLESLTSDEEFFMEDYLL